MYSISLETKLFEQRLTIWSSEYITCSLLLQGTSANTTILLFSKHLLFLTIGLTILVSKNDIR